MWRSHGPSILIIPDNHIINISRQHMWFLEKEGPLPQKNNIALMQTLMFNLN